MMAELTVLNTAFQNIVRLPVLEFLMFFRQDIGHLPNLFFPCIFGFYMKFAIPQDILILMTMLSVTKKNNLPSRPTIRGGTQCSNICC